MFHYMSTWHETTWWCKRLRIIREDPTSCRLQISTSPLSGSKHRSIICVLLQTHAEASARQLVDTSKQLASHIQRAAAVKCVFLERASGIVQGSQESMLHRHPFPGNHHFRQSSEQVGVENVYQPKNAMHLLRLWTRSDYSDRSILVGCVYFYVCETILEAVLCVFFRKGRVCLMLRLDGVLAASPSCRPR